MYKRSIRELRLARRDQRFPTKFKATATVGRFPLPVEIADLSRVGACLRGKGLPARGQEVVLHADGLDVAATVVWKDDHACGLTFHQPISPLVVVRRNMPLLNFDLTRRSPLSA